MSIAEALPEHVLWMLGSMLGAEDKMRSLCLKEFNSLVKPSRTFHPSARKGKLLWVNSLGATHPGICTYRMCPWALYGW